MKKIFSILALAFISTAVYAQTTWQSDPYHSKLGFEVTHLGISDVTGLFNEFDITITSSKEDFSDAVFALKTKMASIDTEVEMRDDHLRSADFFDVEKYPEMTFTSSSIKKVGKNKCKLTGDLSMHGITKPVTMNLHYRGSITNPQSDALTAGFQLTGQLNRSDFKVGEPSPAISDEVNIRMDGEFVKK